MNVTMINNNKSSTRIRGEQDEPSNAINNYDHLMIIIALIIIKIIIICYIRKAKKIIKYHRKIVRL
ncbi:TPA_asm: P5 [Fraxinus gammacytorhabdovirus 1]|nr:TPA_asm: P5 [Fraxinus gammacytorhabdovirus 1]